MLDRPEIEAAWVAELYLAIEARPRPEDVAKSVLKYFPNAPHKAMWKKRSGGQTYMGRVYAYTSPLTESANVLAMLLEEPALSDKDTLGAPMTALLTRARHEIQAEGQLDFRHARLNGEAREAAGLSMSRRRYNKLYRLIDRLEREKAGNDLHQEFCGLLEGAKLGIARHLSREEFAKDAPTAMFVAYMAARLSMRSRFTVGPQDRAYDDLGDALLDDLSRSSTTNWFAAAHVFPREDVLRQLSEAQATELLALALNQMRVAAEFLQRLVTEGGIDVSAGYVVTRGQDSSTWNASAGAWNKARDLWIAIADIFGYDLESLLPGKVPRLMAADVAAWHRSVGDELHPDERVASELPAPWEVLLNGVECTMEMILAACAKQGVDPEKTGWTGARDRTAVETWRATPELVHGVTVNDPFTASVMRRLGWFSGPAKWVRKNFDKKNS